MNCVGQCNLVCYLFFSLQQQAFGGRSLFRKDDITSALSANSITGREEGAKTKMLLFNGLYYRGLWATPFVTQPDNEEFFFMTSEDAMKATMIHAKGNFQTADLEHLNAKVICLPYEVSQIAYIKNCFIIIILFTEQTLLVDDCVTQQNRRLALGHKQNANL